MGAEDRLGLAYQDVGLILRVQPKVGSDDSVTMNIGIEKSSLRPKSEDVTISVSPAGSILRAPRIETTMIQTTVSIAKGEALLLGGLTAHSKDASSKLLVIVLPQVVR